MGIPALVFGSVMTTLAISLLAMRLRPAAAVARAGVVAVLAAALLAPAPRRRCDAHADSGPDARPHAGAGPGHAAAEGREGPPGRSAPDRADPGPVAGARRAAPVLAGRDRAACASPRRPQDPSAGRAAPGDPRRRGRDVPDASAQARRGASPSRPSTSPRPRSTRAQRQGAGRRAQAVRHARDDRAPSPEGPPGAALLDVAQRPLRRRDRAVGDGVAQGHRHGAQLHRVRGRRARRAEGPRPLRGQVPAARAPRRGRPVAPGAWR